MELTDNFVVSIGGKRSMRLFQLRSLDNFHKHKFHFLWVQRFFHKTIHLFPVCWFYNEKYRVLSPLQLSPHWVGFCWPKPLFVEETLVQFGVVDVYAGRS